MSNKEKPQQTKFEMYGAECELLYCWQGKTLKEISELKSINMTTLSKWKKLCYWSEKRQAVDDLRDYSADISKLVELAGGIENIVERFMWAIEGKLQRLNDKIDAAAEILSLIAEDGEEAGVTIDRIFVKRIKK